MGNKKPKILPFLILAGLGVMAGGLNIDVNFEALWKLSDSNAITFRTGNAEANGWILRTSDRRYKNQSLAKYGTPKD